MRINPGKVKFKTVIHNTVDFKLNPCGPFLKVPERFSHSESQKISNRIITCCIIHIFLISTEVPFIHELSSAYTSPILDTDELKMALRARKRSGAFEKRAAGLYLRKSESQRYYKEL